MTLGIKRYLLVEVLCRWLLAGIFLYGGIPKLAEVEKFSAIVAAYGLVPEPLLVPVASTIAALEVVAGAGLLLRRDGALVLATLLMAVFIAVLGYGIWLGLDIDCGCFAADDPEHAAFSGLRTALYRDLLLLIPLAVLYRQAGQRKQSTRGKIQ